MKTAVSLLIVTQPCDACNQSGQSISLNYKDHIFSNNTYNKCILNVGRPVLLVERMSDSFKSLYALDWNDMPFLVYGDGDLLDTEAWTINDQTQPYIRYLAYSKQLCSRAFSALNIFEISSYKNVLDAWEISLTSQCVHNELGWKTSKIRAIQSIGDIEIPATLVQRIRESVHNAPKPRYLIKNPIKVNTNHYIKLQETEHPEPY